jgi:hypothetical protein
MASAFKLRSASTAFDAFEPEDADAARQLEGAREPRHHLAVALAEQLDLPRLVLHELRLIAPLDGAQLLRAAVGEHPARHAERDEADDQQRRQNDVEQAQAEESFEHLWNSSAPERVESGRARVKTSVGGRVPEAARLSS